jgi:internalin A
MLRAAQRHRTAHRFKLPDVPLEQVLHVVDERAEDLKVELREHTADIKAGQREVAAEYAGETANQIRILLRAVTAELPDCPRLFTLLPFRLSRGQRVQVWQTRYRLTLWCEHPGHEHPWKQASYEFTRPTGWFRTIAPYALVISRLLRLAVPLGSATLGAVLPASKLADLEGELDLMKTVAEKALPDRAREELPYIGEQGWRSAEGSGLRALRALLVELDPAMRFGDLRRVLTPSGDYLWVCPQLHYREYDPGLPTLPS